MVRRQRLSFIGVIKAVTRVGVSMRPYILALAACAGHSPPREYGRLSLQCTSLGA